MQEIYHGTLPYDPEGILGCLTSAFLTFIGLQAGKILLTYQNSSHRITRWLAWGALCGLIAGGLCGFGKEGGLIPVNKNLWLVPAARALAPANLCCARDSVMRRVFVAKSSREHSRHSEHVCIAFLCRSLSYVLAMACFAFVLLSAFYVLIDVSRIWSGAPFTYLGEYRHLV